MGSGIRQNFNAVRSYIAGGMTEDLAQRSSGAAKQRQRSKNLGMSPRQRQMNHWLAYYTCLRYEARKAAWDGSGYVDALEAEACAADPSQHKGAVAYDDLPLRLRRPVFSYHLPRVVVQRFTALLFSESRHPKVRVRGRPEIEDIIDAIAEQCRLWSKMSEARNLGGAMGTSIVVFGFRDGRVALYSFDARWTRVTKWADKSQLIPAEAEERCMTLVDERNPDTGEIEEVPYWSRRIVTQKRFITYKPVPVGNGDEPYAEDWVEDPEQTFDHNFGFFPGVWIQNTPVHEDVFGEPDCLAIFDIADAIDAELSQAHTGTVANTDPTLVIKTAAERLPAIVKGTGHALKVEPGGDAKYMELTGTGAQASRQMAQEMRKLALEVVACIIDHPDVAGRTATEVRLVYSAMMAQVSVLHEQYGVNGVLRLLRLILKAAKLVESNAPVKQDAETGQPMVPEAIRLPDKVEQDEDGESFKRTKRQLNYEADEDFDMHMEWPEMFEPSLDDTVKAVQATTQAKEAGLIDDETAVGRLAQFFNVENPRALLAKLRAEREEREKKDEAEAFRSVAAVNAGGQPKPGQPAQGEEEEPDEESEET